MEGNIVKAPQVKGLIEDTMIEDDKYFVRLRTVKGELTDWIVFSREPFVSEDYTPSIGTFVSCYL
jgi:hypothetical protein